MVRRGWWHLPALIVLAAVLFVLLWFVEVNDREEKQKRERLEEEAAQLVTERDQLVKERDELLRSYQEESFIPASEQILILELDERVYTEIYPALLEQKIPAVLGLSLDCFPGDPGMITRDEFDELIKAGWGLCLVCDDGSRFTEWDREISERLAGEEIVKPETVYFPERQFSVTLENEILRCGYSIAVHHGEDRLELIAGDADEGLWLVGAHPWNYTGIRGQIEDLVRLGGEHCYTLRFSEGREEYVPRSFENMLTFIQSFRDKDTLRVTTFPEARRLHDPTRNGVNEETAAWQQKDAEMAERLRELENEIQEIYSSWNED